MPLGVNGHSCYVAKKTRGQSKMVSYTMVEGDRETITNHSTKPTPTRHHSVPEDVLETGYQCDVPDPGLSRQVSRIRTPCNPLTVSHDNPSYYWVTVRPQAMNLG
ncbi:unnamed protein product [Pleuronectes platessa]|uniref:Uncharacterized protein n=1 Tax=Pleuronectes platessa TaxID=8262 RepID=A0A9N7UM44_PLEPL|nr:unnamed protein product [Pleuronectes platessa]